MGNSGANKGLRTCVICNQRFRTTTERKTCSHECLQKLRSKNRGTAWTEAEIEWISEKIGTIPMKRLCTNFRTWAGIKGLPKRTLRAIKVKTAKLAKELQQTTRCTEDNFSVAQLAKGLGVTCDKIRHMKKYGYLKVEKISIKLNAIARADAIKMVLEHPSSFQGCDRTNLFWLLEDIELVDFVKNSPVSRRGIHTPVLGVKGHEVIRFPSLHSAAKAVYVNESCISHSIKDGHKSAGYHWQYADNVG